MLHKRLAEPWPRWAALAIAMVVAIPSGWIASHHGTPFVTDLDQVWFAARALLGGEDPYAVIGPGRAFDYQWSFYYPLPAAVLLLPFAPFPVAVARVALVVLTGGGLAYLIARWRPTLLLPVFLSRAYFLNVWYAQWSVAMACAMLVPALGWLLPAKPTIGLASVAGYRRWQDIKTASIAALIPVAISFLFMPDWPLRWLAALQGGDHLQPYVMLPGGFLLLLAGFRYRRWEARLLLALAIVPQTMTVIGALPLLLIPRRWWSAMLLAALTFLPGLLAARAPFNATIADALKRNDFATVTDTVGLITLCTVYLPALVMVLWPRRHPMTDGTNTRPPDPPPPLATA